MLALVIASSCAAQQSAWVDIGCNWQDPRAPQTRNLLDQGQWVMHYGFYWWSGGQLKSYEWSTQLANSWDNQHSAHAVTLGSVPGYNGEPLSHWKVEISRVTSSIQPQFHSEVSDSSSSWKVSAMAYGTLKYDAASLSWEPEYTAERELYLSVRRP